MKQGMFVASFLLFKKTPRLSGEWIDYFVMLVPKSYARIQRDMLEYKGICLNTKSYARIQRDMLEYEKPPAMLVEYIYF